MGNILGLHYQVAKILGLSNFSLWQRLNSQGNCLGFEDMETLSLVTVSADKTLKVINQSPPPPPVLFH